jgi:hypothetical protein
MRRTTILEKLLPSVINAAIVVVMSLPILSVAPLLVWKISVVAIFYVYSLAFLVFNHNRCLGMIICGTRWSRKNRMHHEFLYTFLYTLSFATLFIWIWFPFDVFLANMLLLQLPSILLTGTTFHGYLSGNKYSVTK